MRRLSKYTDKNAVSDKFYYDVLTYSGCEAGKSSMNINVCIMHGRVKS